MWERPNQESMVRIGSICNQFASDGLRRASPVDRGLIDGDAGVKSACWPDFWHTDTVGFIVDRCPSRHAGHGFGLSRSMRRRMSANRPRGMATSAIWNVTLRAWRTILPHILTRQSLNIVSDQCRQASGIRQGKGEQEVAKNEGVACTSTQCPQKPRIRPVETHLRSRPPRVAKNAS